MPEFSFPYPTRAQQIPLNVSRHQKTPEKNLTSGNRENTKHFYSGSQKTHIPTTKCIISRFMAFLSNHNRKPERRTLLGMIKYIQNLFKN